MMSGKENVRCIDAPMVCDETISVFLVPSRFFSRPVHVVHLRNVAVILGDPYLTTYVRRAPHRYAMVYLIDSRPCIIILDPNLADIGLVAPAPPVPVTKEFGSMAKAERVSMATSEWNVQFNVVGDI
jgi:hypothetical protein